MGNFLSAEHELLHVGLVERCVEMYVSLNRWEQAVAVAETSGLPMAKDLARRHRAYMSSVDPVGERGKERERGGDALGAAALFLKAGNAIRAAEVLKRHFSRNRTFNATNTSSSSAHEKVAITEREVDLAVSVAGTLEGAGLTALAAKTLLSLLPAGLEGLRQLPSQLPGRALGLLLRSGMFRDALRVARELPLNVSLDLVSLPLPGNPSIPSVFPPVSAVFWAWGTTLASEGRWEAVLFFESC